jgi:hypothetical protein
MSIKSPVSIIVNSTGDHIAEIKNASTAAVAADKALVVAVSPNNSVAVTAASLPLPTGAATAANQTTIGNQTTKINDGVSTAAVKAASTPAVVTDPALVVAVSPNSPVHEEYALTAYHAAALWAGESATHTLLSNVSGKSLRLRSVICSSTGNGRFEIKIGSSGSEVTTHVVYTSEAQPTLEIEFFGRSVAEGQQVIIVKTGQDHYPKALDYHTTIAHHFSA